MRTHASVKDILDSRTRNLPKHKRAEIMADFAEYRPKLYKSLQMPSYVHSYSLAIEYMKKWFLDMFPKDFFKYVHVNGKHVLDDWKRFNRYNIKHEKPMLAIVPQVNTEYDRNDLDSGFAGRDIMLRRSTAQQSFFRDYDFMQFIYLQMREMEMTFNYRCRVNTRAQQLDLFNQMEIWFRVGQTQQTNLTADFHIPKNILIDIAKVTGFEVDEDNNIKDPFTFTSYLNAKSDLPIIYKLRAINQQPEWFVRATGLRAHIAIREKLNLDDGEREGKLDTNFHVDMQAVLHIPVPHFYAYLSQDPIIPTIPVSEDKPVIGIYTIDNVNFPPCNDKGWNIVAQTSYSCEKGEEFIDLSPIFNNRNWHISKVIEYNKNLNLAAGGFMEVWAWFDGAFKPKQVDFHMDWNNLHMIFDQTIEGDDVIDIAIYVDMSYVNNTIINIEEYDKNRIAQEREFPPPTLDKK